MPTDTLMGGGNPSGITSPGGPLQMNSSGGGGRTSPGGPLSGPTIGGPSNPFIPAFPSGTSLPQNWQGVLSNLLSGYWKDPYGPGTPQGLAGWGDMGGPDLGMSPAAMQSLFPRLFQRAGMAAPGGPPVAYPGSGGSAGGGGGTAAPGSPARMKGATTNLTSPFGSPSNFPANTGGVPTSSFGNFNPASAFGFTNSGVSDIFGKVYPSGVGTDLTNFLGSGAGFNPQIANAMVAAMQPQIQRGMENIMEQFSASGNRFGSASAIGAGDFMSQVNLNIDQIFAQMMEQSTQNYMNVLLSGKNPAPQPSGIGSIIGGAGSLVQGLAGLWGQISGNNQQGNQNPITINMPQMPSPLPAPTTPLPGGDGSSGGSSGDIGLGWF